MKYKKLLSSLTFITSLPFICASCVDSSKSNSNNGSDETQDTIPQNPQQNEDENGNTNQHQNDNSNKSHDNNAQNSQENEDKNGNNNSQKNGNSNKSHDNNAQNSHENEGKDNVTPPNSDDHKDGIINNDDFVNKPTEKIQGKITHFVRPPFLAKFKIKQNNKQISTFFDHLDSPDNKGTEPDPSQELVDSDNKFTNLKKQGAQEVSEFLALPQVFKWANKQTDFIIFGGDTNIINENYFLARKFVNKNTNIESVLDLSVNLANKRKYGEQFITSLGRSGNYSHQYDKMFFINNDKQTFTPQIIKNGFKDFKIDIYKAFSYFITRQQLEKDKGWLPDDSQSDNQLVRSFISDHAPVFTDINLNTNIDATKVDASLKNTIFKITKDANTIRVAHWNILNYGSKGKKNDRDEARALSFASIIYKSAFDIVGLTEINNGRGKKVQLIVDELNKLIKEPRFKVIVQLQKDTKIREEYLKSKRFGKGQQEQVAIIYDSKNFDLINSASFTYPIKYWA